MKAIKFGFWALLILGMTFVSINFSNQNQELIDAKLFQYSTGLRSKWALLLSFAGIGALLSTLFFITQLLIQETKNIKLRRANKKLLRKVELQQQELDKEKELSIEELNQREEDEI